MPVHGPASRNGTRGSIRSASDGLRRAPASGGPGCVGRRQPGERARLTKPVYVFISYSWDSEEHERRVYELAQWLRRSGVEAYIDKFETSPKEGWPTWCYPQIEKAKFVLVVC